MLSLWCTASFGQTKVVGYMPSYANFDGVTANTDFSNFTHVIVCFAYPNAAGAMQIDLNASQINTLVNKAHASGAEVFISIG
jgi:hypothetical protein